MELLSTSSLSACLLSPSSWQVRAQRRVRRDSLLGNCSPPSMEGVARKTYRKSRNGCKNCKRCKIKVNISIACNAGQRSNPPRKELAILELALTAELKPACGNCSKPGVFCDFDNAPESNLRDNPLPAVPKEPIQTFHIHSLPTPGPSAETISRPRGDFGGIDDLELLLHYSTTVWHTFADHQDTDFWQIKVPRIGISRPFVLHLVLALCALHLSKHQHGR